MNERAAAGDAGRQATAGGWRPAATPGVWRRRVTFHADDRGAFGELWRDTWNGELPAGTGRPPVVVAQANLSRSRARVLRGLHVHQRQADVWVVLEGRAFIGLVDLRAALAGAGPVTAETIDAEPGEVVLIPEGVAHGFYARDAITLLYFVTNEYDSSDEHGFAWNDPLAAVPWPDHEPILSTRDATARPLAEAIAFLRADPQHSDAR